MNNSAAKVGEIFREAGTAFTKLSEMTLMLQPTDDAPPGSKWSEEEVEMLRGCVNRFAVELNKISQHIKTRTMRHLRNILDMDSGTIHAICPSPPRQEQNEYMPRVVQPTETCTEQTNIIKEKTECPSYKTKDVDLDDLFHFNPEIVPLTPPAILMEEDSIPQQDPSVENINNLPNKTFCRPIVTDLVCEANSENSRIGTLHPLSTTAKNDVEKSTILHTFPAFTFQNFNYNERPQRNTDPVPGAYTSFLSYIVKSQTFYPFGPFSSQNTCHFGLRRYATQTVTAVGADLSSPTAEPSQERVETRSRRKRLCNYEKFEQNVPKKQQKKK